MTSAGSSKRAPRQAVAAPSAPNASFGLRDLIALAIVLAVAFLIMGQTGSRRGVELMPWPDGIEYAAQAVNLDEGRGPVLHFGGYSYPSRYTEGYPLILAAAFPIIGHDVARFFTVTIAMGLSAIVAIYLLALKLFGRSSAIVAAILLALCPVFLTYSTLVLSDVPTMAVTMLAAYALLRATEEEEHPERHGRLYATWAIFGFIAGFSAIMRPTNGMIVGAAAIAVILVRPKDLNIRQMAIAGAGFLIAVAIMPLVQMHSNSVDLGGALSSGYGWWVPEVYAQSSPFSIEHLFGPTMPRNPHGNVPVYVTALMGLDGMLGDRGDPRYFLYPFAAAVFAVVGIAAVLRDRESRTARRLIFFGLALLGLLLAVYIFDLFTETAYLLPGVFILLVAAGYGATIANRAMRATFNAKRRSSAMLARAAGVALLDVLLAIALVTELSIRLTAEPQYSQTVASLQDVNTKAPAKATIVSNISLEFLELYAPGNDRKFIGLNSHDPGESFTDYHLNRLFAKRSLGWTGPIPPVLFADETMAPPVATTLATDGRSVDGAFLLLGSPESPEYAALLRDEVDKISGVFTMEPVMQNRKIALFKLTPHR